MAGAAHAPGAEAGGAGGAPPHHAAGDPPSSTGQELFPGVAAAPKRAALCLAQPASVTHRSVPLSAVPEASNAFFKRGRGLTRGSQCPAQVRASSNRSAVLQEADVATDSGTSLPLSHVDAEAGPAPVMHRVLCLIFTSLDLENSPVRGVDHTHLQMRSTKAQRVPVFDRSLPAGRRRAGFPSPCVSECPAHKSTRSRLSHAASGRTDAALRSVGRRFCQLRNRGQGLGFSLERASLPSEGPFAVPAFQRKRASLPPAGRRRAASNFPTMCKLVNLRVCKRGPLKGP